MGGSLAEAHAELDFATAAFAEEIYQAARRVSQDIVEVDIHDWGLGSVGVRLDAIEELVSDRWLDLDCCYKLVIEKEVFWRKGSPSAGREFKE